MASFAIGLEANCTVATGAKPRKSLILLASSGSVENAMNAEKQEGDTKIEDISNLAVSSRVRDRLTDGGAL